MNVAKYLFIVISLIACFAAKAEITVMDDTGAAVTLQQPAKRIISLAPSITETLYAVGAGDRLVGTMNYSDYPEAAKELPIIGTHNQLNYEQIISLQPDLIIGWQGGNGHGMLDKLIELKLPLFLVKPSSYNGIAKMMTDFGLLTGNSTQANEQAQLFTAGFEQLQQQYQNAATISVFYPIWHQPLMTVNGEHITSKIFDICGAKNLFADAIAITPTVTIEAIIAGNPDLILVSSVNGERTEWLKEWQQWQTITAIKQDAIYTVNADYIARQGPRLLLGAREICVAVENAREKTQ